MPQRSVTAGWAVAAGTGRATRRRLAAALLAVLTVLLCGWLTAGPASAQPSIPATQLLRDPVGDVDVDAIVADLAEDHLAGVPADSPDRSELIAQIDRANTSSINLNVVVLDQEITGAEPDDVTAAILASVGGTLLVITPNPENMLTSSQTISQTDLDDALAAAKAAHGDVAAVRVFVDALTATGFPWSLVVIVGVVVLLMAAVAGGLWEKRRREKRELGRFERQKAELVQAVESLQADLHYIGERLPPSAELAASFEQAVADHHRLDVDLAAENITTTEQIDVMDVRVATLRSEILRVRAAVDAGAGT
ncbi:hypothetical protein D1871_16410 [Nakamurella silvestris]|nr:hypothetical protein D1871_16410 [Nakamurella silvestris]